MKNKSKKMLPKITPEQIAGTVHEQYVQCGKKNCKCSRGELHGPYFYHFIRIDGKLHKHYLRRDEVEQMQIACSKRQQEEKAKRTKTQEIWQQIRQSRADLRELVDQIKSSRY